MINNAPTASSNPATTLCWATGAPVLASADG
jgi:hypothetical protein